MAVKAYLEIAGFLMLLSIPFQVFVISVPHAFPIFFLYRVIRFLNSDYETAIMKGNRRLVVGLIGLRGRLCRKCLALTYWPSSSRMPHHEDLDSLEVSASSRCWLCKKVYDQLLSLWDDRKSPPARRGDAEERESHRLVIWFAERTQTKSGFLDDIRGKNYLEYVYGLRPRSLHRDLSSEASFAMVNDWVKSCNEQHKCYQGQEARLPIRVIDVSQEHPYLLVFEDRAPFERPYITLSHCWGGEQPLTTTLSTIEQRKTRISMDSLPILYRDAITVTRNLNIDYLWIDSLCIIQDSKEDWAAESAKMGDIYRLSYLTIFTLSSRNCHEGILIQRALGTDLLDNTGKITLPTWSKADIFKSAPLCQRAWAVQERLLSSRILCYSVKEIFWECLACTARESSFRFKPFLKYQPYEYNKYECTQVKIPLVSPLGPNPSFPVSLPSDWQAIVAEYTRCHLTLPSDKLPALSGLASVFKRNTGFRYLAGLWQEDFPNGLLWFASKYTSGQSLPNTTYRGPSWSWVSTDLAVTNKSLTEQNQRPTTGHDDIKVVDSVIRLAGSDPMGEILYADVTVRASFYKLSYKRLPGSRECYIFDTGGAEFGRGILDVDAEDPGYSGLAAGVIVTRRTHLTNISDMAYVTYFLIVEPVVGGADEDCWKRVGLGWADWLVPPAPESSTIKLV